MSFAFDGAYARDLNAMQTNGAIAVTVYLTGNFAVDAGWVAQIHARGLGVVPNYEQAADELVNAGFAGGQAVGARAMAAAKALGFPADGSVAIVYSIDVNVAPALFPQIGAAFDGINAVTHGQFLAEAYGEGALIDWLHSNGKTSGKGWLSGSSSFPGFNPSSPNVGLVQLIGSPVPGTDQDQFTDAAGIHAWWPVNSPYGAEDMTPAQEAKLDRALALLEAIPASVWAANLQSVDAAGKPDSGVHPARQWITDAAQSIIAAGQPAAAASGQALVRVAALQAQLDAAKAELGGQLAGLSTAVTAIPTVHPTLDVSAVQAAAHDGTKAALTGATIASTITPGA